MYLPGQAPFTLYRGDTCYWLIKVWNDINKTAPADLTGILAEAEIRDQPNGLVVIAFDCTVELPNLIHMEMESDISNLLPMSGYWDLKLTSSGGDVTTLLAGPITVIGDITHSAAGA